MKKSRLLVLAAASAALCAAAVGCGGKHEHEYGEWNLTQAPTLTEEGSATRTCTADDGEVVTVTVPALSNTDVWSSETTDATHTSAGKTVYTSEYGTVEITIAQGKHDWDDWKITKKPNTVTEKGEMKRECKSEDGEEVATIDLTDTSVWKKDEKKSTAADHYKDGADVYVSEKYGLEVSITVSKTTDHDWDDWEISQKPNKVTEKGEVKRVCKAEDGGEEIEEIDLTDTEVWTKDADKSTPANHNKEGTDVYVSEKYHLEVEITVDKTTDHDWDDWEISKKPTTITEIGEVKRGCKSDDGGKETQPIDLTDTSVWKKDPDKSTPNSHTEDGEDVYVSEKYGLEVSITVSKTTNHDWDDWEIVEQPELNKPGTAKHSCKINGCTEQDVEEPVPALNNSVWEKEEISADYNHAAKTVYTSEYGVVEVPGAAKLVAPYDGKTYIPVMVEIDGDGKAVVTKSWVEAQMALDEKGEGKGTAFPYQNESWKVSMVDAEKGKISIVSTPASGEAKTYDAYVDMTTGVIVRPRDASWSTVFVFLPYEWDAEKSHVEAAVLDGSLAITYSKETVTESYFVSDEKALFGVTFASDKAGENEVAVADVKEKTPALVYVVKGELIASYAKDAKGEYVPADGYEGTYTLTEGEGTNAKTYTVIVSGSGIIKVVTGPDSYLEGTYTIAEEGAGYSSSAIIEGAYYETTLNGDFTGTLAMPMVTVKYNVGEGYDAIEDGEFNKNVVATLAKPADTDSKKFGGWYFDEACKEPVPADFKPTADIEIYAKWSDKGSITVVVEEGGAGVEVYFGDEDKLSDVLAAHGIEVGVDETNWRVFRGWYTDTAYTQAVPADTGLEATDNGKTIYAKWEALPVYYGEFTGNKLNTDAQYCFAATVDIDEDGIVTFTRVKNPSGATDELKGKVTGYTEATQVLTWKVNGADTVYRMWFDKTSGFIAFADEMAEDALGQNPYVVSRNGDTVTTDNYTFGFYNGNSSYNHTCIVTYETEGGESKTLLIYTDKIYADVSLSDYKGDALAVNEVANSKTLVVKQSDTVVLALGNTGTKISASTSAKDELNKSVKLQLLDTYYGKYTVDGTDYFLNGLGQIAWEGVGGTASAGYTFVEDKDGFRIFDVFERKVVSKQIQVENPMYDPEDYESEEFITETISAYENVGYYQLKVATASGTSTFEKIMVTVTVGNATTTGTGPATTQVNAKVEALPEALKDTTGAKIFVGWYTDPELDTPATATAYEVGDTPTLYAKWETRVTVTVHFNYENKTEVYEFAEGDTVNIPELTRDGYYLVGLYTDEDCTDGNEWAGNGAVINANAVVYAKWELAAQMAGTYKGTYIYTTTQTGASGSSMSSFTTTVFSCEINGAYTSYRAGNGTIADSDKATTDGTLPLDRYTYFNKAAGIIWTAYNSSTTTAGTAVYVAFDVARVQNVEYSVNTSFKVDNVTKTTMWLLVTYTDGSTMKVFCYDDIVYDNVTWTEGVAASKVNDAKEIQVWDKDGEELFLKVKTSSTWGDPKAERGTYTNDEGETINLNGGDQIIYGDKKGTYSAVTGQDYNYNVDLDGARYWLTVEGETFSIKKPMATVTFNMNGHGEAVTQQVNISKYLYFSDVFSKDPTADGFIFRGWYENQECTGNKKYNYQPTDETPKPFYAKWDKAITVTLNYGGKMENVEVEGKYAGDTYTPALPTDVIGGQAVEAWYANDSTFAEANKVTGSYTFTDDTIFYAKWVDAHALYGSYNGHEVYKNYGSSFTATAKNFTVDLNGALTGKKSGQFPEIEAGTTSGFINVTNNGSNYYTYFDLTKNFFAMADGTTENSFSMDAHFAFKAANVSLSASTDIIYWNDRTTCLMKFTVDGETVYVFWNGDNIYPYANVSVTNAAGEEVTDFTKFKTKGNVLTVTTYGGVKVGTFGYNGTTFVDPDGTDGRYTASTDKNLGEFTSDGFGGYTLAGTAIAPTVDGNKLTFVVNNSLKVIEIDVAAKTYTQVQDGYQGIYTLPGEGAGTIELDGYGEIVDEEDQPEGRTYVVSGGTLTVYSTAGTNGYGINVETKTLSAKSVFAGLTFTGKYTDSSNSKTDIKIVFDDSADTKGVIYSGYGTTYYFNFEAILGEDEATHKPTLTFTIGNAIDSAASGKTIVATITGDTITITSCGITNGAYSFANNGSATCPGFSL